MHDIHTFWADNAPVFAIIVSLYTVWKGKQITQAESRKLNHETERAERSDLEHDYGVMKGRAADAEAKLVDLECEVRTLRDSAGAVLLLNKRDGELAALKLTAFATIYWLKANPEVVAQIIRDTTLTNDTSLPSL